MATRKTYKSRKGRRTTMKRGGELTPPKLKKVMQKQKSVNAYLDNVLEQCSRETPTGKPSSHCAEIYNAILRENSKLTKTIQSLKH